MRRGIRVYYGDLRRDYPAVWEDVAALGTYVQLLARADVAWPDEPDLPRSLHVKGFRLLTETGLIIVMPGDRYRVKGYDEERTERQSRAESASRARWGPERNPTRNADRTPKPMREGVRVAGPTPTPTPTPTLEDENLSSSRPTRSSSRQELVPVGETLKRLVIRPKEKTT